jgi:hypothetical protein
MNAPQTNAQYFLNASPSTLNPSYLETGEESCLTSDYPEIRRPNPTNSTSWTELCYIPHSSRSCEDLLPRRIPVYGPCPSPSRGNPAWECSQSGVRSPSTPTPSPPRPAWGRRGMSMQAKGRALVVPRRTHEHYFATISRERAAMFDGDGQRRFPMGPASGLGQTRSRFRRGLRR